MCVRSVVTTRDSSEVGGDLRRDLSHTSRRRTQRWTCFFPCHYASALFFFSNPRSHVDCLPLFLITALSFVRPDPSPPMVTISFQVLRFPLTFFFPLPFFLSSDDLFCLVSRRRAAVRHEDPLRQTGQAARLPGAPLQPGEPPPPLPPLWLTEPTPAVRHSSRQLLYKLRPTSSGD